MRQEKFDRIWNSLEPKPHQRPIDFIWVMNYVEKIKPKVIVEIGMATGGSLKYWEQILIYSGSRDGLIISVDNNIGCSPTWDWKNSKIEIHLVYGDSNDPNTAKKVKDILAERKIDFLFIDGGHRYSIPERDFNNFSPLVQEGGTICVADLGEPCPSHTFLQLPEPKEVDSTICMGMWKKPKEDIKVELCSNQGESDDAYTKTLNIFRHRVPNPP